MKDLFETPELIPHEVQAVFNKEIYTYKDLKRIQKQVEKLGYTFDYGLDAVPYELRKIKS